MQNFKNNAYCFDTSYGHGMSNCCSFSGGGTRVHMLDAAADGSGDGARPSVSAGMGRSTGQ